jgi:cytochrome c-type biogenesis protein CcmH/NrfG
MEKKSDSNADEKLATAITHTLDKSVIDIDEVSVRRLKNARENALSHLQKPSRTWINFRVAASLAVLMLIPVMFHQYSQTGLLDQDMEVVSQDVPYSAEEMDDIEMLMSLDGDDA